MRFYCHFQRVYLLQFFPSINSVNIDVRLPDVIFFSFRLLVNCVLLIHMKNNRVVHVLMGA